jgi:hypothetical protein
MPSLSALRDRVGSFTLGLAVLALVALVCVIASILFATRFVEDTIGLVVENLSARSGVSVFLVKAVVILGTIPFFWAVGKFTKNIWGLLNLGWDSMSLYKNKYGIVIVAYVGIYFLAMYGATLEAYEYKFCADTPEGIWTSDSPGKDPVYGIEAKACTLQQRLALRAGTGHLKPPREITIGDVDKYDWFDPVTGQPRVWYSLTTERGFRFFDGRGVDPHDRQELKPVSPEIIERIKRQQAGKVAAQKEEEKEATDEKLKADAATLQAQKESEMVALAQQAQSAFESKDYRSAFDKCSQVLNTSPGNQTCITVKQHASVKLCEDFVRQGQAHFERGEFDEAVWSAEKALGFDPTNQNALKLKKLSAEMKPQ